VKKLLDAGVEVDARNHSGETALIRAAAAGALDCMVALIERGASLNATDGSGKTPLGAAVSTQRFDAAKLLLEKKADPNARIGGASALAVLADKGRGDFVRLLVDAGADVALPGAARKTPLMAAAISGNTDIVKILLGADNAALDARDGDNWTALAHAVKKGRRDIVNLLLEAGADPETTDSRGLTPFNRAAVDGRTEIMALLYAKGVRIDVRDNDGDTPLHLSVSNENVEAVRLLLRWGADLEVRDGSNQTALDIAEGSNEDIETMIRDEEDLRARGQAASQQVRAPTPAAKPESGPAANENETALQKKQFRL
jgi:ankyrin repeat protein